MSPARCMSIKTMKFLLSFLLILQARATLPPGHGKELGEHNDLKSPAVEEDYTTLNPLTFYEKYLRTRTPVILRGLAKTFPAFDLWTDEYIKTNYGDLEVRLEAKTEKETYTPIGDAGLGRSTFEEFFDRYKTDNMYCVSEVPEPMYKDLKMPALMNCGTLKDSLVEMNLWINSGGAKSIIHKDAHNQLNCLLAGSKDWIFINNSYNEWIYQAEEIDGDQGGFSLVNPDKVNYKTFPLFEKIPWTYATVHAGDCLYLPPRYYHRVKSTNRNFAVSFLFGTKSEFEMAGCDSVGSDAPLEEMFVQWRYPGKGMMSMGNSGPQDMKNYFTDILMHLTENDEKGKVDMDMFIDLVMEEAEEVPYMVEQFHKLLIEEKVLGEGETIDADTLLGLSNDTWYKIAAAHAFEPSNHPDFEYYRLTHHEVSEGLKAATYYGALDKDAFVAAYKKLEGSGRIGRELFDKLTSDEGKTVSWYDIKNKDHVFEVFGKEHDRGDDEMHLRNSEIHQRAQEDIEELERMGIGTAESKNEL